MLQKCETCKHRMSGVGYKGKLLCAAFGKNVKPAIECKKYAARDGKTNE